MGLNKRIVISILTILMMVSISYLIENVSKERGLNSASIIKVLDNNKVAALMGVDVLKELKEQEFPNDEDVTNGPTLLTVLAAAGTGDYRTIEIKGLDNQTLYRASQNEINKEYIFIFTDHGTVNLCKINQEQQLLVKDVSEINTIH